MKSCFPILITQMRSPKKGKKKQTARHVSCLSLNQSINTNAGEQPFTLRLCKCLKQVRKSENNIAKVNGKQGMLYIYYVIYMQLYICSS